ncbi:spore germination protein GerPE [Bacillus sp. FJAT-29814]|uniref:spore germination protein GerPE n=1 Tax=Bacillus sp. FJAT-29814 TaxID=1729688 RepID=UPI00082E6A3C|nr:spore germination protein GerPE [Bacillus sp. FJAT-29814]
MLERLSNVDRIEVMVASFSSILQLGDSCIVDSFSRAIAVQREAEIFYGNEGNPPSFPVTTKPIPFLPITEALSYRVYNSNPVIKVHNLEVIGFSNASILHVGNTKKVSMEARVKHIRQLLPYGHEQDMR